jgi:malate dehydrogenase (oxaloacetate-decarboxylating)
MEKLTVEELLAKAKLPGIESLKLHPFYQGKVEVVPKCAIRSFDDFAIWYTPGVAEPCKEIKNNIEKVYELTNKWNNVAVVSDGTRVLGLGDIGPHAGMPVIEGKAVLFKYLGGVDAFPICLATKDSEEIIKVVKIIEPCFGGINLEDIEQPKCFRILDTLREEMAIPVWHDDQQGTAAITLAGLINALKLVGKKLNNVLIAMIGAGAANICAARILIKAGVDPGNMIIVDNKGILNADRKELKETHPEKWELCLKTNSENRIGSIPHALNSVDVCVAASKPGPGTIKKDWLTKMNDNAIVFTMANPIPELWPWEAKEAGARIVATGRSDFPNQINNSLGFPGIFRGTLDVRAETITDEMCIAASYELAKCAEDKGIHEDYIIPTMDDWEVFPREATAVAVKAIEQGVARKKFSRQELYENACAIIERARNVTKFSMDKGFIKKAP